VTQEFDIPITAKKVPRSSIEMGKGLPKVGLARLVHSVACGSVGYDLLAPNIDDPYFVRTGFGEGDQFLKHLAFFISASLP
jgi:hypothetical protein